MVGTGATISTARIDVLGLLGVGTLSSGGDTNLCINSSTTVLSFCSSSLRYKTHLAPYNSGLNILNRLRPITFDWKEGGMHDLGLGAEDVAKIDPLLVTYNAKGEVEGVKYDRIGVVLVNAVKQQQTQIEKQRQQMGRQQMQIEAQQKRIDVQDAINKTQQGELHSLKALVCSTHRNAAVCKSGN